MRAWGVGQFEDEYGYEFLSKLKKYAIRISTINHVQTLLCEITQTLLQLLQY